MANTLKLIQGYDFQTDAGTVDLLSYTADGFNVAYQGWKPKSANYSETEPVDEAITLRVRGTNIDSLGTALQKMADKARQAWQYNDSAVEPYGVWLRAQLYGESGARQAFVVEIETKFDSSVYSNEVQSKYHVNQYTLGIKRMPWWEATTASTITAGSVSAMGGMFLAGTIPGDTFARMGSVIIAPIALSNGGTIPGTAEMFPTGPAWLGFRSSRYSNPGSFVPWVNAISSGTSARYWRGYMENSRTADTYSKAGSVLFNNFTSQESTYGTAAMALQTYIRMEEIITTPSNMLGSHLVLLRARPTATDTQINVQMAVGFQDDEYAISPLNYYPSHKFYSRVPIISYSSGFFEPRYKFYEMGIIDLPPYKAMMGSIDLTTYSIYIFGQRISGTGSLYIDGYAFIPTEGMIKTGVDLPGTLIPAYPIYSSVGTLYARTTPDGQFNAITHGSLTSVRLHYQETILEYQNGIPPGTVYGVFASDGEREVDWISGASTATYYDHQNAGSIVIKYFPCWREMRGGE